MSAIQKFHIGDFELQAGGKLSGAWIAYKTFGDPASPAVLYPSWYSGTIADNEWLIGEDKTLNPNKYFIIVTALIGNGESISPSNSDIRPFPAVAFYDNVRAQHLLLKGLGISHLRAVLGWSMGAGQSYQWATQYPDMMDICVPFCGSAKTSLHNKVFLEGTKAALIAAKGLASAGSGSGAAAEASGKHLSPWTDAEKTLGLKAIGRVYAGWGFSQAFYREELYKSHYGAKTLEEFMVDFWEGWFLKKDPENLLVMLQTWQNGDVSQQKPYNGDFKKAMSSIRAQTLILPSQTDLYFPPEDSTHELACMSAGIGKMEAFPSIWGHWAGGPPGNMDDVRWLDERLAKIFNEAPNRALDTKMATLGLGDGEKGDGK